MTELHKFIKRCRNYSTGMDSAVELLPAAALVMEELAASADAYKRSMTDDIVRIREMAELVTEICAMSDLILERLASLEEFMGVNDVE